MLSPGDVARIMWQCAYVVLCRGGRSMRLTSVVRAGVVHFARAPVCCLCSRQQLGGSGYQPFIGPDSSVQRGTKGSVGGGGGGGVGVEGKEHLAGGLSATVAVTGGSGGGGGSGGTTRPSSAPSGPASTLPAVGSVVQHQSQQPLAPQGRSSAPQIAPPGAPRLPPGQLRTAQLGTFMITDAATGACEGAVVRYDCKSVPACVPSRHVHTHHYVVSVCLSKTLRLGPLR